MNFLQVVLFIVLLSSNAFAGAIPAIYGEDDIFDFFEYSNEFYDKLSNSTVMLTESRIVIKDGTNWKISVDQLTNLAESSNNLCKNERFSNQTRAGHCTGFLITKNHIMTAGHCIKDQKSCENTTFIFGNKFNPVTNSIPHTYKKNDVYKCNRIIERKLVSDAVGGIDTSTYEDYAIVELDRQVIGHSPRPISTHTELTKHDELLVIGHPFGLPQKIARNGFVIDRPLDFGPSILATDLDTFGGNSGSPIFRESDGSLEGILVAGFREKFQWDDSMGCNRFKRCENPYVCSPSIIQKIKVIPSIQSGFVNSHLIMDALNEKKIEKAKELLKDKFDISIRNRKDYNFLQLAIWNKDLELVNSFLSKGARINDRDKWGRNAFIWTAIAGWIEGAKFLVKKRAPINTVDTDGETALYTAAQAGHTDYIKYLLSIGANVKIPNRNGSTPLMIASIKGHWKTVLALLDSKAININIKDHNRKTAFSYAVDSGNLKVINRYLNLGVKDKLAQTFKRDMLLKASFAYEFDKVLELIKTKGLNLNIVDRIGNSPLYYAIWGGSLKTVKALIKYGANPNARVWNRTIIYYASQKHLFPDILRYLLTLDRIDVNSVEEDGLSGLHLAAIKGHTEIVKILLDAGANPNTKTGPYASKSARKRTPIYSAWENGHYEICKLLFDAGARFVTKYYYDSETKSYPNSIINWLYTHKSPEAIDQLLNIGYKVNSKLPDGTTLLFISVIKNYQFSIKKLINLGANINHIEENGESILSTALFKNDKDLILYLIRKGANLNFQNPKTGDSLLHDASLITKNTTILETLLRLCINTKLKNNEGETAKAYAKKMSKHSSAYLPAYKAIKNAKRFCKEGL